MSLTCLKENKFISLLTISGMHYTEIINIEAVFKALGMKPDALKNAEVAFIKLAKLLPPKLREKYIKRKLAEFVVDIITLAINGDWEADWTNTAQTRLSIWWFIKANKDKKYGFGLSYLDYANTYTVTFVGARHVFENIEKLKHAAQYFSEYYEDYYFQ